jgi:hypothetical protein
MMMMRLLHFAPNYAKSKAEIQKAYRERKKLREGEAYLKKERERIKAYYVPIDEKPQRKAEERRQKVRECCVHCRCDI